MKKRIKEEKDARIFFVILIFLTLILAGFLIFANWKIGKKREELLSRIEELKKEIEILEKRNQELKKGISETEKESFWETKIREQGYKKPGEKAIVIKKEKEVKEEKTLPKNIWEKFLEEIKFWEK